MALGNKETLMEFKGVDNEGGVQLLNNDEKSTQQCYMSRIYKEDQQTIHYTGRGSFSVVKAQYYRGSLVAVKCFLALIKKRYNKRSKNCIKALPSLFHYQLFNT